MFCWEADRAGTTRTPHHTSPHLATSPIPHDSHHQPPSNQPTLSSLLLTNLTPQLISLPNNLRPFLGPSPCSTDSHAMSVVRRFQGAGSVALYKMTGTALLREGESRTYARFASALLSFSFFPVGRFDKRRSFFCFFARGAASDI